MIIKRKSNILWFFLCIIIVSLVFFLTEKEFSNSIQFLTSSLLAIASLYIGFFTIEKTDDIKKYKKRQLLKKQISGRFSNLKSDIENSKNKNNTRRSISTFIEYVESNYKRPECNIKENIRDIRKSLEGGESFYHILSKIELLVEEIQND